MPRRVADCAPPTLTCSGQLVRLVVSLHLPALWLTAPPSLLPRSPSSGWPSSASSRSSSTSAIRTSSTSPATRRPRSSARATSRSASRSSSGPSTIYQGEEGDVVIFSTVRNDGGPSESLSKGTIGFLKVRRQYLASRSPWAADVDFSAPLSVCQPRQRRPRARPGRPLHPRLGERASLRGCVPAPADTADPPSGSCRSRTSQLLAAHSPF